MSGIPAWAVKGAKVVCVDDDFPADAYHISERLPTKGQVYTVRDLERSDNRVDVACFYASDPTPASEAAA